MNKDELKAILEAEGIKSMFYSLNGVRYDECLVLENPNVGCWNVYLNLLSLVALIIQKGKKIFYKCIKLEILIDFYQRIILYFSFFY